MKIYDIHLQTPSQTPTSFYPPSREIEEEKARTDLSDVDGEGEGEVRPYEDIEEKFFKSLSKEELEWLGKYKCGWCDHSLDQPGCEAIGIPCKIGLRIKRTKSVLHRKFPEKWSRSK